MRKITVLADVKKLDEILAFIDNIIEPYNCSPTIQFQLEVALEEIYVNIAYYAYPNAVGETTIRCKIVEENGKPPLLIMDILDQGNQYNPLEHKHPDIDIGIEDREIGGLGIFIVRESMDSLDYRYEDNNNIFTLRKYLK